MKRCLVTGGTGFTGSHLIKKLSELGYKIIAPVRKQSKASLIENLVNVSIVRGDISDKKFIDRLFAEKIDLIFHVAAAYRDASISNEVYWGINYNSTKYLLDAALEYEAEKYIHCSTIGVAGHVKNPPADETAAYAPGDIYQITKCEAEKLVLSYFKEKGLKGSIIRPTAIYGPGDMRIFKFFKLIHGKKFIMLGKGQVCYHLVFIDDLVKGFILASQKEAAQGEIFIIGGKEYVPLTELVSEIAAIINAPLPRLKLPFWPVWLASALVEFACKPLGINPPIFRRRTDLFRKSRAFDISKAERLLGYEPSVSLSEGLKITANWYKEQKLISF